MGIFKKEKQEGSNVLKLIKRSNNIISIFKKLLMIWQMLMKILSLSKTLFHLKLKS